MSPSILFNAALVLIDVQKAFDDPRWGQPYNPHTDANIGHLLGEWRRTGRPVVHVKHDSTKLTSPLSPDAEGNEIKEFAQPHYGEPLFHKNVNSAFIGTGLEAYLHNYGYSTVVIVGWVTDHCVSTTARMSGNLGFNTYVVDDACATHDRTSHTGKVIPAELIHESSLASLHGEFATVCSTEEILAAMGGKSNAAAKR
jgi:nicotinamidase-related amidase